MNVNRHMPIPARNASKLRDRVRKYMHSLHPEENWKPLRKSTSQVSTAKPYHHIRLQGLPQSPAYAYTSPSNLTKFGNSPIC